MALPKLKENPGRCLLVCADRRVHSTTRRVEGFRSSASHTYAEVEPSEVAPTIDDAELRDVRPVGLTRAVATTL
jgi:hypothetical protein